MLYYSYFPEMKHCVIELFILCVLKLIACLKQAGHIIRISEMTIRGKANGTDTVNGPYANKFSPRAATETVA